MPEALPGPPGSLPTGEEDWVLALAFSRFLGTILGAPDPAEEGWVTRL